jgi:hypothetical protein
MEKAIMKAVKTVRKFILFSASVLIFSAMTWAQTEIQRLNTEKTAQPEKPPTKVEKTEQAENKSEKTVKTEISAEKKAEPQSTPPETKIEDKNTAQSEEAAAILPYYNNYLNDRKNRRASRRRNYQKT